MCVCVRARVCVLYNMDVKVSLREFYTAAHFLLSTYLVVGIKVHIGEWHGSSMAIERVLFVKHLFPHCHTYSISTHA